MLLLPELRSPLVGLGMASFVLGLIGLMLFFLPILGIPLSVLGLLFGLVGLGRALMGDRSTLGWSLYGIGFCALALLVTIAIVYAPSGYNPSPTPPPPWQAVPDRPYVPSVENPVMK